MGSMDTTHHHGVSPYESKYGFARAIRVGDTVHVAGTAPVPEHGGDPIEGAGPQMRRCVAIASEALTALGSSLDQVVRTRMYLVDPQDADEVGLAHAEMFGGAAPAATMVVVAGLLDPAWKVEIEVEAIIR